MERLALDDRSEVLALDHNGGFAAGNNAAIEHLRASSTPAPDFVLLLNPDTVVRPGAIDRLTEFIEPIRPPASSAAASRTMPVRSRRRIIRP